MHSFDKPGQGFSRIRRALLLGTTLMIAAECKKSQTADSASLVQLNEFGIDSTKTANYLEDLNFVIASTGDSVFYGNALCGDPTKCPSGGVRMMFIPELHAERVDWKLNTQAHHSGDVVAIMLNVDSVEFPDLELKPGHFGYAWVGQNGPNDSNRGFAIYTLTQSTGLRAKSWWVTSNITYCNYNQPRGKPAIKGENPHANCDSSTTQSNAGSSQSTSGLELVHMVAANPARGLWVSCSSGCCEVNGTTFLAGTNAPLHRMPQLADRGAR